MLHKVDGIMKEENYLIILQLYLKSKARWLKHGHILVSQKDNDPKCMTIGFGNDKAS